jgi:hypothetical protein
MLEPSSLATTISTAECIGMRPFARPDDTHAPTAPVLAVTTAVEAQMHAEQDVGRHRPALLRMGGIKGASPNAVDGGTGGSSFAGCPWSSCKCFKLAQARGITGAQTNHGEYPKKADDRPVTKGSRSKNGGRGLTGLAGGRKELYAVDIVTNVISSDGSPACPRRQPFFMLMTAR